MKLLKGFLDMSLRMICLLKILLYLKICILLHVSVSEKNKEEIKNLSIILFQILVCLKKGT